MDNPDFSTLASAVKTAELTDTLSGEGPFTLFAPTNAAFSKIPDGELKAILTQKAKLTALLTHHVVAGKVMSHDIQNATDMATVEGSKIMFGTKNGVTVNDAKVTMADIECSNGVIHAIDTVLLV